MVKLINNLESIIFNKDKSKYMSKLEKKKKDTDLESEKIDIAQRGISESDEETEQKRKVLKMMTPKQMIIRLPILLAQLKAGKNSQNEIRQIAYSLYRSKDVSKTIYNNLINTI